MDKVRHMDDPDARNLVMPSAGNIHVHLDDYSVWIRETMTCSSKYGQNGHFKRFWMLIIRKRMVGL